MVFQSYALYPHMTVRRNIEFPLKARHMDESSRDRLVSRRRAQPAARLDARSQACAAFRRAAPTGCPGSCDRTQTKGVPDGRALSNLDAQLRLEMRAELVELHARLGITLLYVTHDQIEAMTMGHRIAVMSDGVLQQLAAPGKVHD